MFWVDFQFAEEFSGDGIDDADAEVLDEQDDVGSGVGSADRVVKTMPLSISVEAGIPPSSANAPV